MRARPDTGGPDMIAEGHDAPPNGIRRGALPGLCRGRYRGGAAAFQEEASPSPVYGARLLSGFGASTPSRVQIPPPPRHEGGSGVLPEPISRCGRSSTALQGRPMRTDSPVPRRAAVVGVLAVVAV